MSRLSIVTREQSLKLKELGFNWGCVKMYGTLDGYSGLHSFENYNQMNEEGDCSAPDVVLALKWLRDEKGIFIDIQCQSSKKTQTFAFKAGSDGFTDGYKTFEEAEIGGLDFALNRLLIKNK